MLTRCSLSPYVTPSPEPQKPERNLAEKSKKFTFLGAMKCWGQQRVECRNPGPHHIACPSAYRPDLGNSFPLHFSQSLVPGPPDSESKKFKRKVSDLIIRIAKGGN